MTINPQNLYGIGIGTGSNSALITVLLPRDPTADDISNSYGQYSAGQRWINTITRAEFYLPGFISGNGTFTAGWVPLASNAPAGAAINTITSSHTPGSPVPPDGTQNITFTEGSNITIIPDPAAHTLTFNATAPAASVSFTTDDSNTATGTSFTLTGATTGITTSSSGTTINVALENPLTIPYGGTGIAEFADINSVVLSGIDITGEFQTLTSGVAGTVLTSQGLGVTPTWAPAGLPTLPLLVPEGGTGDTSFVANQIITGGVNATAALGQVATGTANQALLSGGAGLPVWSTATYPATTSIGDTLISSSANAITSLPFTATATCYIANTGSGGTVPQWDQINLTNGVVNTLPVGNGGTGISTTVPYEVLIGGTTTTGSLQQVSTTAVTPNSVLTYVGPTQPPAWQNFSNGGGGLLNVQIFSTAGSYTYTPTVGMEKCIVICVGGGGGGSNTGDPPRPLVGGGGGGAGYVQGYITAAQIGASQPIHVGLGGQNSNGEDSTFGTFLTGGGGGGAANTDGAGLPGVGSGTISTYFVIPGFYGGSGQANGYPTSNPYSGFGGSSAFGQGGWGGHVSSGSYGGSPGIGIGAGGSGGYTATLHYGSGGGSGRSGIIIIYEYGKTAGAAPQTEIITGNTAILSPGKNYLIQNATPMNLTTLTLPPASTLGDTIKIIGSSPGGWRLIENTGQEIIFGNKSTTVTSGSLSSTYATDQIDLFCIQDDLEWQVVDVIGNLTVA